MKIYDFYYRLKGDKNSQILCRSFTAPTKESAKLMAKSAIGKEYVIVKIEIND